MRTTRRLLSDLNSLLNTQPSWAAEADIWIHRATEWTVENFANLPPLTGPVRVTLDAPGRTARYIQVYEAKLLLASLEQEPAPAGSDQHSLFSTIRSVRIEWRCRVAGERRLLATLLLMRVCSYAAIRESYGVPHIAYTFDPEQPMKTGLFLEWPEKHAAVMSRIERAYEPRQKLVDTSPTTCSWQDDIAPTVRLQFVK
jgi:hypothetical protein